MIWAVEYSPEQQAFHVDALERALALNRQTAAEGRAPGYIILTLARTSEEAHSFCEAWRREHFQGPGHERTGKPEERPEWGKRIDRDSSGLRIQCPPRSAFELWA